MPHAKAVRSVRLDNTVEICTWHADYLAGMEAYPEMAGYTVVRGICPECIEKFKADSLKDSSLQLSR